DTEDLDGNVTVRSRSDFSTAGIRFMHGLCCRESCDIGCGDCVGGCDSCTGCGSGVGGGAGWLPGVRRTDFLWGIRWADLDEQLWIREDLIERGTAPDAFIVNDMYDTTNQITGAEVGFRWQWERQRWSLDLLSKIALGNTEQTVRINGSTTRTPDGGAPETVPGGLLALPAGSTTPNVPGNIGVYERDQFSVMPELGIKLGYMFTDRLRLSAGYTFLYWSNVVRPGDQITLQIDPNKVPRFDGNETGIAPEFRMIETGMWAQGLDFGAEYRW
ncbi:MAG: BBP7 family outer membrane beta-barrel protein, partial [Lacipirellulaceae bacterium]